MAFELERVVPWGRTLSEYQAMFDLQEIELLGKIAGFGDGPASFNCELTKKKGIVKSFDPLYQFTKKQISQTILETKDVVMKQIAENKDNYIWKTVHDLSHLEKLRMGAMQTFLEDFDAGLSEGRYISHELPSRLDYPNDYFDLGLSSHFLLMYTALGEEFHKQSIQEMMRVCKEVRIYPVVDLDGNETELTKKVIEYFRNFYYIELVEVAYRFQKNGNKMLKIKKSVV